MRIKTYQLPRLLAALFFTFVAGLFYIILSSILY